MQHAGQCRQAERSAWLWATCRTDSTCNLRLRGLAYDSSTILNVVFLFKSTLNVLLLYVMSQRGTCVLSRAMKQAASGLGLN